MQVITQTCINGTIRLITPCGNRYHITADPDTRWDRAVATRALDTLVIELGVKRSSIRFYHLN